MDYQKKYPIAQLPGKYVLAEWNRGYKDLTLSYNGREISYFPSAAKISKGIVIKDEELITIGLKFSERPMMLDLIIDGYHSPVNGMHPVKELKRTAPVFWIITVFALLVALMEGMYVSMDMAALTIVTSLNVLIVAAYVISAIFVGKGKAWAYIMGFCVFSALFLFFLLTLLLRINMWSVLSFIIRSAILGVLIYNMRTAVAVIRHSKYASRSYNDLLDS